MPLRSWLATLILPSLALLACAHASAAEPRQWYILNFGTGKCIAAAKADAAHPTPDSYHHWLRASGITDTVKVQKDDDNNLQFVAISVSFNGDPITLLWFPSAKNCEVGRSGAIASGLIPDEDDLK